MVVALACDLRGHEFNSLGKLFTHMCLCITKQYNLVAVAGQRCPATGKVTVGLASHWPCVTDLSGLSTYRLKVRETSTPPTLLMGYGTLSL